MDNAEELIRYIRDCIEKLEDNEFEPIITPTMYDPTDLQDEVTIIVMEQIGDDTKPKFRIDVIDLEALRKKKRFPAWFSKKR